MTRRTPTHRRSAVPVIPKRRALSAMSTQDWQERGIYWSALLLTYAAFLVSVLMSWTSIPALQLTPFWVLIPLFTWSITRPELLSGIMIFLIGILSDIVIGTPLGIHAIALLSVQVLVRLQQRFLLTQNFLVIWANFTLLSLLFTVVVTVLSILSIDTDGTVGGILVSSFWSWGILAVLFPPLSAAMHAIASLTRHGK